MANDFIIDQILAQVLMFPETHDQDSWEEERDCGTTRCVAGWAVHFSEDYQAVRIPQFGENVYPVRTGGTVDDYTYWSTAGAEILGLDERQADYLFFETNEAQAVEFLKDLKNGS